MSEMRVLLGIGPTCPECGALVSSEPGAVDLHAFYHEANDQSNMTNMGRLHEWRRNWDQQWQDRIQQLIERENNDEQW